MSRNHYTKSVREYLQACRIRQEKELAAMAIDLRCQNGKFPEVLPVNKAKQRRSVRIEEKRRRQARRRGVTGTDQMRLGGYQRKAEVRSAERSTT